MFGYSCLTICPDLEDVVCFCAGFLDYISSSQGPFDGFGTWVFGLLLSAGKD